MKKTNKFWLFGGVALIGIIIITIFSEPANNLLSNSSTYSRTPDKYGAYSRI